MTEVSFVTKQPRSLPEFTRRKEAKKWLIWALRLRGRSLRLQPPRPAFKSAHFLASKDDISLNLQP